MKIIGALLILLITIVLVFLAVTSSSAPLPTIKSNEAADYLWERVQMEITPVKQLEDEYRSHPFYVFVNYTYYHVYNTREGILILVEKPNELFLEKTVKVIGRIEKYYKRSGDYELIISQLDLREVKEDRR